MSKRNGGNFFTCGCLKCIHISIAAHYDFISVLSAYKFVFQLKFRSKVSKS